MGHQRGSHGPTAPSAAAYERARRADDRAPFLDEDSAFAALGAVHDARMALRALPSPPTTLIDTLALHERELGVALGATRARAWLKGRRAR